MRGNSIVRHLGESLRRPRARRRLLEVVLVAARLHRLPDGDQEPAQGRGAAVSLLGPVAGGVARLHARGLRRERAEGRPAARRPLPHDAAACWTPSPRSARRRRTAPGSRSSRCRSRDHEQIDAVGRFLFERGIYVTLAAYPLVPKDEVGFRVQVTAANTDEQIARLIDVLGDLSERFALQPAAADAVGPAGARGMSCRRGGSRSRAGRGSSTSRSVVQSPRPLPVRARPVPRERPAVQRHLGVVRDRDPRSASASTDRWHRGRGAGSRSARRCSSSATSTPTAIRSLHRPRGAVPVGGRRPLPAGLPGADDGRAARRAPAQPAGRPRRRDRRADHHRRHGAAVVGLPDGAVRARRDALAAREDGLDRVPARRRPPARGGAPAGVRRRPPPRLLLPR